MLLLGVDGGGTKTAALLVDENGTVLSWSTTAGSNYHIVGIDLAYASVRQGIDSVLAGRMPDAAVFCMAGADLPHDFAQLQAKLKDLTPNCPVAIRNDVIGVFRAGSRFRYGVGIVCGTGFNAGGIAKDGTEFRLPALGAISGDSAGARRLGVRALGAAFRAWDGRGERTVLADAILLAFDAPDFETVAELWVQGKLTQQQVEELVPLIFELSELKDPVAQRLIREEGVELGVSANAVLRKLKLEDEECDIVLGGSVAYGKGDLLLCTVKEEVARFAPKATVHRLDLPPVVGAVLLAADDLGLTPDEPFMANLRSTLPREMDVPLSSEKPC